jgi:signal transduction histidine kinase
MNTPPPPPAAPPTPPTPPLPPRPPAGAPTAWQRIASSSLAFFHGYAGWLVGITWLRFFVLSILLLIVANLLQSLPPFSWRVTEIITTEHAEPPAMPKPPAPPAPPTAPREPAIRIDKPGAGASVTKDGVSISIDERGVRITPRPAQTPAAAGSAASAAASDAGVTIGPEGIEIRVPPGSDSDTVREAIREARDAIREAIGEAKEAAREAAEEARDAAQEAKGDITVNIGPRKRTSVTHFGDFLTDLAFLWIFASAIIKITYRGRMKAEAVAAQATETAEAESLKRQVVEARMAAMQAQVEPHFLFNTLASIDHLIETDPKRASVMQKNLITLLRASMPTMREANASGVRELGRELAVIQPYLEILKVRMEDRLQTELSIPDGLRSAEFPPMMIQSLVENAIKHGLEPKPDGGRLTVKAEIVHGKLAVTVADTGLGFGKAATAGTGIGLNNIRERLQLLYGHKATLVVAENQPSGTVVTITVPYVVSSHGNGGDATMKA